MRARLLREEELAKLARERSKKTIYRCDSENFTLSEARKYLTCTKMALRRSNYFSGFDYNSFQFEGNHHQFHEHCKMCWSTSDLWDYIDSRKEMVEPNLIVGTSHIDYKRFYPKSECGKFNFSQSSYLQGEFPGKRRDPGHGYLKGWDVEGGRFSAVYLQKHPTSNKYIVAGDGNHRVMKSKLEEGPPIHASVGYHKWNTSYQILCALLPEKFLYLKVFIDKENDKIFIKLRIDRSSSSITHVIHCDLFCKQRFVKSLVAYYLKISLAEYPRFRLRSTIDILVLWRRVLEFRRWKDRDASDPEKVPPWFEDTIRSFRDYL